MTSSQDYIVGVANNVTNTSPLRNNSGNTVAVQWTETKTSALPSPISHPNCSNVIHSPGENTQLPEINSELSSPMQHLRSPENSKKVVGHRSVIRNRCKSNCNKEPALGSTMHTRARAANLTSRLDQPLPVSKLTVKRKNKTQFKDSSVTFSAVIPSGSEDSVLILILVTN